MAHENKVLRSVNTPDGGRCVDVFMRPDGSYGFEEFRRDAEDAKGWFAIGGHAGKVLDSEQAAFDQALVFISWLKDAAVRGG